MSESEPHFSKRTLQLGERFTHSSIGRAFAWIPAGSFRSTHRQLDWTSQLSSVHIPRMAEKIAGNPRAFGPARFWGEVAVVGASDQDLEALSERLTQSGKVALQAVAYTAEGVVYVGHHPKGEPLFNHPLPRPAHSPDLQPDEAQTGIQEIAFRKGIGPLSCTLGYMALDADTATREFYSVDNPLVIARSVALGELATTHPGTLFI